MKETPQTDDEVLAALNAAAKTPAVKKVNLGAIGSKKKAETKTQYPGFPDPNGEAGRIAARIIQRTDEFDALESALKTDKAELKQMVSPFYFSTNAGKVEVPSSIAVDSGSGEVLVTFPSRYTKLSSDAVLAKVPFAAPYFREQFTIGIDGDKIPADKVDDLIAGLVALFAMHNCEDALSKEAVYKPVPEFHMVRHSKLTPEQNLALDQVVPIIAMVKTKGRK